MDKYTGKRLDGRYEIQELIGVGGMAMVYKAYDTVDDTAVAIKILKDEFLGNSEFMRRFKNESKAIAVLSHPNIVKVNDVSFGDKIQYIVMEYIDGITLKEYISHQHVIPWKEAVHFTVQILQALQHAHEKGIVHRDMKPQNIMLLQDGTIKVTDFGIARFSDNETRTMTDKAIGSVHYIAPEQARGDNTDGKADIYSVGVMLYEMLTGKLPFEADSAVSVAIMQMQNDPKPLREINDKIPEGIEEITLRAMRKDPKQRYASAKEMLEAIEIFRHNPSVKFRYSYFVDETPTKYVESINKVPSASPEPSYDDTFNNYDDVVTGSVSRAIVKWITVLVALMVVAAIGLMIWMMVDNNRKATETKDVEVPQFVGQMYDEIQKKKEYKFKFDISAQYQDDKPMNVVLSQDPEAGSKEVKENATIKLVINSKSTTTQVPKVKNYVEQEAVKKLQDKYFNYNIAKVNSTEVQKGYVIECSPQEGTVQEIGTAITLIVSDGPATEKVEVPDVTDQSYAAADAELKSKGFTTQKAVIASAKDEGVVVGTDPLAGNKLTKGSLITIQVSDASLQKNSLKQNVPLPAEEAAQITLTVYEDGKELLSKTGAPADGLELDLEINPSGATNGKKNILVKIDGQNYAKYTFDFKNNTVTQDFLNTNYKIKTKLVSEPESSKPEESSEESTESSTEESSTQESSTDESSASESSGSGDDTELDEYRTTAISNIEGYVSVDDYDAAVRDKINHVIDVAKKNINTLNDKSQIDEEVTLAKSDIDEIVKAAESTEPPAPDESSASEESSGDDLEQAKQAAITEITNYMNKYYYSDEEYENAKSIVSDYSSKINAASSESEILDLDIEAQQAIDAAPHRTESETSETAESPAAEMYSLSRIDPSTLLFF